MLATNLMFSLSAISSSTHVRSGPVQLFSEFVATFGLLTVIWGCVQSRPPAVPFAVGAYITSAYWFTASTSFASPAVTLARSMSNTFAGIRPADTTGFIAAQVAGAFAAIVLTRRSGLEFRFSYVAESMRKEFAGAPHATDVSGKVEPDCLKVTF